MVRDPTEPPDLFSTDGVKAAASKLGATKEVTEPASQRHILPKNLRHAVSQLSDGELDELCEVAFDEAKRRGRLPRIIRTDLTPSAPRPSKWATKRLPPAEKRRNGKIDEVALTLGQVNAVRAAFKAGITPARIARQFGISQSNVRKALSGDPSK
jgi:predicted DNA-binding protein (UPF0251 family)